MRLPGFPVAEPGETVASVVARHLERTAGPRSRSLGILRLRNAAAHSIVPLRLAALADSMPYGHPWAANPHEIVAGHTLLPLYLHFANSKRRERILTSIQSGSSNNPAASLGLTTSASRNLTTRHKFCAACVANDVKTHGFSIAYREHQPAFVRVCAVHLTPLLFDCARCATSRKALSMWRMAGRCRCENPQNQPAHIRHDDPAREAGVIWLAKQVRSILSDQSPHDEESPANWLRGALIAGGYGARVGLNSDAIVSALVARYGSQLLQELGVSESARSSSGSRWPSRLLSSTVIAGDKTPDVLLSLLLTGLISNETRGASERLSVAKENAVQVPAGYSMPKELRRKVLGKEAIELALRATDDRISSAAARLKVSPSRLAVDMQRQNMRLPLSKATTKRLGIDLIDAVRTALLNGTPKIQIQHSLKISEWSIQLIELDCPALRDEHRESTIKRQREEHRRAVQQHRQLHPSAGRTEIMTDCSAAFDWLRRFDAEWLDANLPNPKYTGSNGHKPRKDWPQIDRACVDVIQATVRNELEKDGRPTRISTSRLLREAGALQKQAALLPLAHAEAKRHAESEEAYLRRRIKWALCAYSSRHTPISMNQLRRVAALRSHHLLRYKEYITELAQELCLTIDARCAFSPHHRQSKGIDA